MHFWLRRGWFQKKITGTLKHEQPEHTPIQASHESIYRMFKPLLSMNLNGYLVIGLRRIHRMQKLTAGA